MFWEGTSLSAGAVVPILRGMSAPDHQWCEDVARHLLLEMDAEDAPRATVDDVCAHFGLRMSSRAAKGCQAAITDTMRVPAKGHPENRAEEAAHEVGHLGVQLWDAKLDPHPEEVCSLIGLLVEIPRAAAIHAVRECGFDPELLRARFPGIHVSSVLTRCALATGGLAVLVRARSGPQWAANDLSHDDPLTLEFKVRTLVASARQREGYVEAGEWAAAPIHEPGRRGILVVRR